MKFFGCLDNYIEMHRERHGLSQDDLAFLIGVERGETVSKFEMGVRFPTLESVLAFELVFGEPIRDIYAGIAERVRDSLTSRARMLIESLGDTPSEELVLKLELLSKLAHPDDVNIIQL